MKWKRLIILETHKPGNTRIIKSRGNLNKKAKTKAIEEKTERRAVLKNPADKIPPGQFKKQSDHKAIQNKGITENKKTTEKIRLNGKLKSQGQQKKG